MNFREKLFFRFQQFNVAEKLIAFNVIFFVLPLLVNTFLFLFKIPIDSYTVWFELSSSFSELVFKPWTLISYSFLHSGFFHLFFNMYIFLFTSRLFLNLFKSNSLLNVYFLGVIFGGLLFLFSYNFFPAFENSADGQPATCKFRLTDHIYFQKLFLTYSLLSPDFFRSIQDRFQHRE